jgi:LPLT family lysophospholipid transporter-like MFS transporter
LTRGFYLLIAAQFVSGLADNALLIVTIARLQELAAPAWWVPLLKLFFTIAYVVLAPLAGPLADNWRKGRVMLAANGIKAGGALLLITGLQPLAAFAIVGTGAAVYSPAKYGLVTELVAPRHLVAANGWIEVSTVCSIVLGIVLGGVLVGPLAGSSAGLLPALLGVLALYALAAGLNTRIPDSGARYARTRYAVGPLLCHFWRDNLALWRDMPGRTSLAVTTLFWGVGATLQFVVLRWATEELALPLEEAAYLQGVTAVGITAGAWLAGRTVPLRQAPAVLPLGVAMGLLVPGITALGSVHSTWPLLVLVGGCAGFFVVPMNALLQHRGHALLSAGRSIAVQNFNENLSVLLMLGLYAALLAADVPLVLLVWGFGLAVAAAMALIASAHHRARHPNRFEATKVQQESA